MEITLEFELANGHAYECDFLVYPGFTTNVDSYIEYLESEECSQIVGTTIIDADEGYSHPDNFEDLEAYADYLEQCEEHGEAYILRYEDIGEHDFEEEYQGCFDSEKDFAEDFFGDFYNCEVPNELYPYIDWESVAKDIMMDYSSYEGSKGLHIFRD